MKGSNLQAMNKEDYVFIDNQKWMGIYPVL